MSENPSVSIPPRFLLSFILAPLIFTPPTAFALDEEPNVIEKLSLKREVLFENNFQLPSKDINAKMIRVTFPHGFKTPWHTHEGPGPRYIIKGRLKIIEGGRANTYSAGEVFWESGQRMLAENIGEGEAELVIFQLAPSKKAE
ncbi:MAG: cupin domain-containing protein [Gammaproteobacteria bacterium]